MFKRFDTKNKDNRPKIAQEYEQKVLDIARVARVTKGGRRFSFRATIVIGNKKGKVGVGVGKGRDVAVAIDKGTRNAENNIITVPITPHDSIPYESYGKQTSALVFIKPGRRGRGIIAGGAVRAVCNLAGYKDITGKILGRSRNKLNNALATIDALQKIRYEAPHKAEKKVVQKADPKGGETREKKSGGETKDSLAKKKKQGMKKEVEKSEVRSTKVQTKKLKAKS